MKMSIFSEKIGLFKILQNQSWPLIKPLQKCHSQQDSSSRVMHLLSANGLAYQGQAPVLATFDNKK
jgi:hypothetical protein